MDEQLLKDLLATAEANNWNWDVVMPKFPELEGVDLQLLKDYAATAKADNYDYSSVNQKFPELFPKKKTIQDLLQQKGLWFHLHQLKKNLARWNLLKDRLELQYTNHTL